jgi:ABC-type dipeptide/oligopeptide/nickel transport system permease subunit
MSNTTYDTPRTLGQGYLFGIPMKDLGWFASLLMGLTTGFMCFFAATFLAIVSILFYNSIGHHAMDYSYSYSRVGLPVGIVCALVALGYLGTMWAKRIARQQ